MLFTRKPLFIACAIASSVLFTACSNNTEEKKQDSLTASAPDELVSRHTPIYLYIEPSLDHS